MRITKADYESINHAFGSTEGLAEVVRRLTQEVEVLKTMLRDKGVWDEPTYKKAIVDRFVADHNSAGIGSERHYAYFPYVLKESSFLKYRFNATDEEIAEFERRVEDVSYLT